MTDWHIYEGTGKVHDDIEERLPDPPQPLFITGKAGVGKSSLAYAVAHELALGPVLVWPITTRVTLKDGLFDYDAIGRLQDASLRAKDPAGTPPAEPPGVDYTFMEETEPADETEESPDTGRATGPERAKAPDIGKYIRLGPLGTALLARKKPRVLLIDEIDKSDIDLPNDLLHIFEEGTFVIPELARLSEQSEEEIYVMPYDGKSAQDRMPIRAGRVLCESFPLIIMTSNGEREFPPAFLRRCLRLDVPYPDETRLTEIVKAHLGPLSEQAEQLVKDFLEMQKRGDLATDQLLNAIYFTTEARVTLGEKETLRKALLKYLTRAEG